MKEMKLKSSTQILALILILMLSNSILGKITRKSSQLLPEKFTNSDTISIEYTIKDLFNLENADKETLKIEARTKDSSIVGKVVTYKDLIDTVDLSDYKLEGNPLLTCASEMFYIFSYVFEKTSQTSGNLAQIPTKKSYMKLQKLNPDGKKFMPNDEKETPNKLFEIANENERVEHIGLSANELGDNYFFIFTNLVFSTAERTQENPGYFKFGSYFAIGGGEAESVVQQPLGFPSIFNEKSRPIISNNQSHYVIHDTARSNSQTSAYVYVDDYKLKNGGKNLGKLDFTFKKSGEDPLPTFKVFRVFALYDYFAVLMLRSDIPDALVLNVCMVNQEENGIECELKKYHQLDIKEGYVEIYNLFTENRLVVIDTKDEKGTKDKLDYQVYQISGKIGEDNFKLTMIYNSYFEKSQDYANKYNPSMFQETGQSHVISWRDDDSGPSIVAQSVKFIGDLNGEEEINQLVKDEGVITVFNNNAVKYTAAKGDLFRWSAPYYSLTSQDLDSYDNKDRKQLVITASDKDNMISVSGDVFMIDSAAISQPKFKSIYSSPYFEFYRKDFYDIPVDLMSLDYSNSANLVAESTDQNLLVSTEFGKDSIKMVMDTPDKFNSSNVVSSREVIITLKDKNVNIFVCDDITGADFIRIYDCKFSGSSVTPSDVVEITLNKDIKTLNGVTVFSSNYQKEDKSLGTIIYTYKKGDSRIKNTDFGGQKVELVTVLAQKGQNTIYYTLQTNRTLSVYSLNTLNQQTTTILDKKELLERKNFNYQNGILNPKNLTEFYFEDAWIRRNYFMNIETGEIREKIINDKYLKPSQCLNGKRLVYQAINNRISVSSSNPEEERNSFVDMKDLINVNHNLQNFICFEEEEMLAILNDNQEDSTMNVHLLSMKEEDTFTNMVYKSYFKIEYDNNFKVEDGSIYSILPDSENSLRLINYGGKAVSRVKEANGFKGNEAEIKISAKSETFPDYKAEMTLKVRIKDEKDLKVEIKDKSTSRNWDLENLLKITGPVENIRLSSDIDGLKFTPRIRETGNIGIDGYGEKRIFTELRGSPTTGLAKYEEDTHDHLVLFSNSQQVYNLHFDIKISAFDFSGLKITDNQYYLVASSLTNGKTTLQLVNSEGVKLKNTLDIRCSKVRIAPGVKGGSEKPSTYHLFCLDAVENTLDLRLITITQDIKSLTTSQIGIHNRIIDFDGAVQAETVFAFGVEESSPRIVILSWERNLDMPSLNIDYISQDPNRNYILKGIASDSLDDKNNLLSVNTHGTVVMQIIHNIENSSNSKVFYMNKSPHYDGSKMYLTKDYIGLLGYKREETLNQVTGRVMIWKAFGLSDADKSECDSYSTVEIGTIRTDFDIGNLGFFDPKIPNVDFTLYGFTDFGGNFRTNFMITTSNGIMPLKVFEIRGMKINEMFDNLSLDNGYLIFGTSGQRELISLKDLKGGNQRDGRFSK